MFFFCLSHTYPNRKLNKLAALMLAASLTMAGLFPQPAEAVEATLMSVEITRDEPGERPGLFVADHFEFDLPQPLIDALHRGIALYFTHEFSLVKTRWYWFDKPSIRSLDAMALRIAVFLSISILSSRHFLTLRV